MKDSNKKNNRRIIMFDSEARIPKLESSLVAKEESYDNWSHHL